MPDTLLVLLPLSAMEPDQSGARPGPDRPLVVDGYVRPANQDEWTASRASVQRWQIARWTSARGWRLGRIFQESRPARPTDPMPLLRDALERVEARESDGIVIVRLNQIGGTLREAVSAIERIEAAGGTFASVGDGIDLSTPNGRLILRLLLSVLEW